MAYYIAKSTTVTPQADTSAALPLQGQMLPWHFIFYSSWLGLRAIKKQDRKAMKLDIGLTLTPQSIHGWKLSVTDLDIQESAHLRRDILFNKMLLKVQFQQV
jgi:hypothetical protein